jgi:hypothetical protein
MEFVEWLQDIDNVNNIKASEIPLIKAAVSRQISITFKVEVTTDS